MRRVWVLVLLSVVACSEKQGQVNGAAQQGQANGVRPASAAGQQEQTRAAGQAPPAGQAIGAELAQHKSEAALANKDETCPGGTVRGCWDAASEAEVKGELARAAELYTRVCDAGGARACNVLGILSSKGSGVNADLARAYSLFMRACDGGDMSGCYNAAICHKTGECAEKNDAEATKLLQRACVGGDKDACDSLGGG